MMTGKQKRKLRQIIMALGLFLIVFGADLICKYGLHLENGLAFLDHKWGWFLPFGLYFSIYLLIGHNIVKKAFLNICNGRILDENFLMAIATFGAFVLGIVRALRGEEIEGFDEACAVLLFYQVGEWFQKYAVGRSRHSIADLMSIRPDYANRIRQDGIVERCEPEKVRIGEFLLCKPGEKVPLDSVVVEGHSFLDTKALTGESILSEVTGGAKIISGSINLKSTIKLQVIRSYTESAVSRILELVENASEKKARSEGFITRFSRYYTPVVVGCAFLLALIPGIITGQMEEWGYRALSFLVVSCPCALVISVPLTFFAGIGGASSKGILVKGSVYLESLHRVKTFVFDKTGTLTKGSFKVVGVFPEEKREEILSMAAIAERQSNHPIATAIVSVFDGEADMGYTITNIEGKGIEAKRGKSRILCGSANLMQDRGIAYVENTCPGTVLYVAKDQIFIGSILIADEIKPEAQALIKELNNVGCETVMLTGDNSDVAEAVAEKLGIKRFYASLLPQHKVEMLEKIMKEAKGEVAFIGDGINDAPVLMRADIGISMGSLGSDAAIGASDIVLMNDKLSAIGVAKGLAEKTMSIVYQNIILALGIKIIILGLAAIGYANMWLSVIGDVGVAVLAILNAMRAGSFRKGGRQKYLLQRKR